MSKRKFDWNYYREKYIFGGDEITLELISTFPGSPVAETIRRRASKEKWSEQRQAYRHKTATRTTELVSSTEAEVTARHVSIAKNLQVKALKRLQALNIDSLSPNDARLFLKDAIDIERKALGLDETYIKRKIIAREAYAQLIDLLKDDHDTAFTDKLQERISRAMEAVSSDDKGLPN